MPRWILPFALVAAVLALGCEGRREGAATTSTPTVTSAAPPASASADPAPADSADEKDPPPAKAWGCGAKGETPCPMQGWMKRVMATASASGDGQKLAAALTEAGKKPPPGYTEWTAIAEAGAAKAKKGDIDGAKASCKKCHDAYKQKYKATMRADPW